MLHTDDKIHQCLVIDGWLARKKIWPMKNLIPLFSSQKVGGKPTGKWRTYIHKERWLLNKLVNLPCCIFYIHQQILIIFWLKIAVVFELS